MVWLLLGCLYGHWFGRSFTHVRLTHVSTPLALSANVRCCHRTNPPAPYTPTPSIFPGQTLPIHYWRLCFVESRVRGVGSSGDSHLSYPDFLEALCRLAHVTVNRSSVPGPGGVVPSGSSSSSKAPVGLEVALGQTLTPLLYALKVMASLEDSALTVKDVWKLRAQGMKAVK